MNTEAPIAWNAERLWRALQPHAPGISVEVVGRVLSTNTVLLERAHASYSAEAEGDAVTTRPGAGTRPGAFGRRAADLQPCLLVAEHQSAGRGRHGRGWQSQRGASLTFSLSMPMAMLNWSGLSLAVGVAVAEALDGATTTPPRIALKWPNDLWLIDAPGQGRKLGGILIETVSAGPARLAIVGIGINVLRFDARETATGLASWQEIEPEASAPAALERIAVPLVQAMRTFESEGFAPFAARFAARDLLRDRPVTTTDPARPEGVGAGVSEHGELLLRTSSGTVERIAFGDVSVRPATLG